MIPPALPIRLGPTRDNRHGSDTDCSDGGQRDDIDHGDPAPINCAELDRVDEGRRDRRGSDHGRQHPEPPCKTADDADQRNECIAGEGTKLLSVVDGVQPQYARRRCQGHQGEEGNRNAERRLTTAPETNESDDQPQKPDEARTDEQQTSPGKRIEDRSGLEVETSQNRPDDGDDRRQRPDDHRYTQLVLEHRQHSTGEREDCCEAKRVAPRVFDDAVLAEFDEESTRCRTDRRCDPGQADHDQHTGCVLRGSDTRRRRVFHHRRHRSNRFRCHRRRDVRARYRAD